MITEDRTILELKPLENFVETDYVKNITHRAFHYIKAGFAVHFRGPAGTGKTTIAKHLANLLGQPLVMIHGDEELTTSNMIGGEYGFRSKTIIDNYIASVVKKEENFTKHWIDNRLTVACRYGFTLIYDEFTRSRPEANNVLLSILEEKMINLPISRGGEDPYLPVHENFAAIFTSNPEEYAGVYKTQDALRDRMVTIDLDFFDYETEVAITKAKSEVSIEEAIFIVNIVRALRDSGECEFSPTVRAAIMIAKTSKTMELLPTKDLAIFIAICQDILGSETSRVGSISKHLKTVKDLIKEIIEYQIKFFGNKNYQNAS
ncbi:MAG: gas vesicle protein GvpN [Cytophagales bacterium]|nr:MAG: gas vesicle protein GvpN [Cytophagales bacterium]